RIRSGFALLAPLALALSPQFVIWNASGLENSLYVLLLVASLWRLLVEAEVERAGGRAAPGSAVLLTLLMMSRPEGMMYAAAAVAGRLLVATRTRCLRPLGTWLLVLVVPFALYNGWRFWYFGWPLPNTYYAKAGSGVTTFHPFGWEGWGWKQVKNYFITHRLVVALPLLPIAMTGLRGWRRGVSIAAIAWLSVVVLWDGKEGLGPGRIPDFWRDIQQHWDHIRVWSLLGWAIVVGLVNFGRRGWLARGLLWCFFCGGIFFHVYTGHEWMKAWRWFNIIGMSMFPLMVVGLAELLDGIPLLDRLLPVPRSRWRLPAWTLAVLPVAVAFASVEVQRTIAFAENPETSVRDIHRRVAYMSWVQRRLDLDNVTLLDVDMGAHMFFSGWRLLDQAGLIDVPFAHHRKYDKPFMREYLFKEQRPDFAHVHSNWARATRIPTYPEWKQGWLEIPGYPIGGRKLHVGNHIRKDHLVTQGEQFDQPDVEFEGGVRLLFADVRSPIVPNGGRLYVHLVFDGQRQADGFQVLAFLDDGQGHRSVAALDPGYGWYPPEEWKRRDQVHGYFRMPVGAALPPGRYRLGIALVDEATGRVRAVRQVDGEEPPEAPTIYLPGEFLLPGVEVEVTSLPRALAEAVADHEAAMDAAARGDCDRVWPLFKDATRHVLADTDWRAEHEGAVRTALARCLARRADSARDRDARARDLVEAMRWDHRAPGLTARTRPLAAELVAEGDAFFAAEDWAQAYDRYALALQLDPRLSHVRRRAEEARDYKLDIRRPGEPYPPPRRPRG
ncbi:MAG: hypothetical protein D6798_03475, partial [Deltaproteobacteria bacterium]